MRVATVFCRAQEGIAAPEVKVEVHIAGGLPSFNIVGLAETAVKESKDRVRSALQTAQFEFPTRRITVGLAPADLPKEGNRYDLAIALGVLAGSGQIPTERIKDCEFIGELGLNGDLRAVRGILPVAIAARDAGRSIVVPKTNADEAALVDGVEVLAASNLHEVCGFLARGEGITRFTGKAKRNGFEILGPDLRDVRGQHQARRALEVAAAGGHNMLFFGPPGTGKTMLAKRLPGILPPMTEDEAQSAAAVRSIAGIQVDAEQFHRRAIRAPHHTASGVALVGGGAKPRPGEISLAHNGVLFLDELPEFSRHVLEVLREPLESGSICISRAARQAEYPAKFQLLAAMNPCPCGYAGTGDDRCRCTPHQINSYRRRVSGPLLDRIDLHVEVPRITASELSAMQPGEDSRTVRRRVVAARSAQFKRQQCPNAELDSQQLSEHAPLSKDLQQLLDQACDKLRLSARAHDRICRLARTICDLRGAQRINRQDLLEAIQYRRVQLGGQG